MQRVRIKLGTIRNAALALLVCVIGAGACGGESSDGGSICEQGARKLRGCDLLTEGTFECEEPDSSEERCNARCVLDASCAHLNAILCEDEDEDEGPLGTCFDACEAAASDGDDEFACIDGSTIPADWRCDGGLPDCLGGEDEADCPSFACGGGETVSEGARCDGFAECTNGADETGCPTFRCGDGETVPESYRCDGEADCTDGADEAGCARPICGGEPIPPATPPAGGTPPTGGTPPSTPPPSASPPTLGPGAGPACAESLEKLRGCGLATTGEFACNEPTTEDARCGLRCILDTTCADLNAFVCLNVAGAALEACLQGCQSSGGNFVCTDGSAIPAAWRCDGGLPDCFGGEDEANCPTFTCGSGENLPPSARCDGLAECADASDEAGCPMFSCGGVESVPQSYRCDDEPDCANGADEVGCGQLTCGTN